MAPPETTCDELVALLGHSIRAKPVRVAMKALAVGAPKNEVDSEGNRYDVVAENRRRGVSLTFLGYRRYRRDYGEAPSVIDPSKDELVLVELEFSKAMPFGLARGDTAARVVEKVGRKASEKSSEVSYGQAWWFRFDEFTVIAALDRKARLLWVRVFRVDARERARKELQATLRKQNKNIRAESHESILGYRAKLPTTSWTGRKAEGDTSFTDEGIGAAEAVLVAFVDDVATQTPSRSAAKIHGVSAIHRSKIVATMRFYSCPRSVNSLKPWRHDWCRRRSRSERGRRSRVQRPRRRRMKSCNCVGVALLVLGCGQVAPLNDASVDAGIDTGMDAGVCSLGAFGSVRAIDELNTPLDERGLRLSTDERSAVYWRADAPTAPNATDRTHLFIAVRDGSQAKFVSGVTLDVGLLAFDGGAAYPSLSIDTTSTSPWHGTVFYENQCEAYIGGPQGDYSSLCEYRLDAGASAGDYWGLGVAIDAGLFGLGTSQGNGFVTPDGKTYYFVTSSDAGHVLQIAHRAPPNGPEWGDWFDPPYVSAGSMDPTVDNPVTSLDELTLIASTIGADKVPHIIIASRATTSDAFTAVVPVHELDTTEGEYPSWLSPDRCRLYFTRKVGGQWDLFVASRTM